MKKTNNIKYFFLSIFALLLVVIFGSERALALELDTVWVSDINGQVLFQHPVTKNIFVQGSGTIKELDSKNGKLVRTFPLSGSCIEFSPDGNKVLYCAPDGVRVFNITTLEDDITITSKYWYPKFLGNDKIVFLSGLKQDTEIGVYDLQTKDIKLFPFPSNNFTAFSASPNGKYISYATYNENIGVDSTANLYLMDVETMKEVSELGNWDSEGQRIESISFSPNSKYLTYNTYYTSKTPINIYNLENRSIFKSLKPKEYQFESVGFEFLGNDYYIQKGSFKSQSKYDFGIYKFANNEEIYRTTELNDFLYYSKFNSSINHLTYNNRSFDVVCIDFNKIISGVLQSIPVNVKFQNKKLIIS